MTEPPHRWIQQRLSPIDLLFHGGIALGLVSIYLSAIPYEFFLYTPGETHLGMTYLSKLGHISAVHLGENLLAFLSVSLFALLLLAGIAMRRLYYTCVLALFLVVPPLTGLLVEYSMAAVPSPPPSESGYRGAGFSTVGASFLGLLAGAICLHQRRIADFPLRPTLSMGGLLALGLCYPALIYGWQQPLALVFAGCGLTYLLLVLTHIRSQFSAPTAHTPVMMSLFGTVYYIGVSVTLFPRDPGFIGVGAHLLGLCSGFLIVWLVVVFDARLR